MTINSRRYKVLQDVTYRSGPYTNIKLVPNPYNNIKLGSTTLHKGAIIDALEVKGNWVKVGKEKWVPIIEPRYPIGRVLQPLTFPAFASSSGKFQAKAKDKTHCLVIRENLESNQTTSKFSYEGFVQFKEYTTLGEFAKWFGVSYDKHFSIKAEHVEAFEKSEDIYAEFNSGDVTNVITHIQKDNVNMRYDDAPLFHLDTEWLLQLDRSARNKKEIVSLRKTLGKTVTELAELKAKTATEIAEMKAMFLKLLDVPPPSQASAVVDPPKSPESQDSESWQEVYPDLLKSEQPSAPTFPDDDHAAKCKCAGQSGTGLPAGWTRKGTKGDKGKTLYVNKITRVSQRERPACGVCQSTWV